MNIFISKVLFSLHRRSHLTLQVSCDSDWQKIICSDIQEFYALISLLCFLGQDDSVYVWSGKQRGLGKERRTVKD